MKNLHPIGIVLNITAKIKPILVRVVPIALLRRIKKGLVDSSMDKLSDAKDIQLFSRTTHSDGVNLIGYIRGEIGLGHSCRLVASGLEATNVDFTIYNYTQVSAMRSEDHTWDKKITNTTPYNINLIHIQPYELPLAFLNINRKTWDGRYNIAFWLWELEQFPKQWENALNLVDEIWTPSEFSSSSIRKVTEKPVHTIPYAMSVPDTGGFSRKDFQLPKDKFLFLTMYDCNSTLERKNPIGAINAYKMAFTLENQDVGIVVKVNNPQKKDIQIIENLFVGYPNIHIISEVLEKARVNALIKCVDVYVSLHRAEGFGLVPAEAMFLGTSVIATNWSSNTEFMNHDVACMVDYDFIMIEEDTGPYPSGSRWADPDIKQASEFMKLLYIDREFGQNMAIKAKNYIEDKLSPERAAKLIRERITEIYKEADKKGKKKEQGMQL